MPSNRAKIRSLSCQSAPGQQLVRVHVSNGHRTSGGPGPGVVEVPLAEAQAIVQARHGRILGPDEQPGDLAQTSRIRRGVTN